MIEENDNEVSRKIPYRLLSIMITITIIAIIIITIINPVLLISSPSSISLYLQVKFVD